MCFKQTITVLQGLLTPVIAISTVVIAYQQWRTNRHKLKLELYSRRFQIYEETKKIISRILIDLKPKDKDLQEFLCGVSEADFLFEPAVRSYIDEIWGHAISLMRWNNEYRDSTQVLLAPPGYDHQKVVDESHKETLWFAAQFEDNYKPVKNVFRKYLDSGKLK